MLKFKHIICAVAVLFCIQANAEVKLYTRKAKLEDFPTKITKVVIGGQSIIGLALKNEVNCRWRSSPFEFCDLDQYQTLSKDNSFYFLSLIQSEGIIFLSLSKGGADNETDNLKKPFEIVRLPLTSSTSFTGREIVYLGAFVDIIQTFTEDAMLSDITGYAGLSRYNRDNMGGRRIITDPDESDKCMSENTAGTVSSYIVSYGESGSYKLLISTDTHELFYYKVDRTSNSFSPNELNSFAKRNGKLD